MPSAIAQLRSLMLPVTALLVVPGALFWWGRSSEPFQQIPLWSIGLGSLLALSGLVLLGWTISLLGRIGRGTLAPWNPIQRLVVVGPYSHVRNPMLYGALLILAGEALVLWEWRIGAWAALFLALHVIFSVPAEERILERRFGAEYQTYKCKVPRWIPRWRAWHSP